MWRRRDKTRSIGKQVGHLLHPGEEVRAGVEVALEGRLSAQLAAASRAADGLAAVRDDPDLERSKQQARSMGVEGENFFLVLTDARVLLVRRSAFARAKEAQVDVPLSEVDAIRVLKQSGRLDLHLTDGRTIELEVPRAFKFLPLVYERLPQLLQEARAAR